MKKIRIGNIYSKLPLARNREVFQTILNTKRLKIERIVSKGQFTPKGKWLREKRNEWVIVLKGRASLTFRRDNRLVKLKAGDYIFIPAKAVHRVEWTTPRDKTIWLAIHLG